MTKIRIEGLGIALAAALVAGCSPKPTIDGPSVAVQTVETKVPVVVPCKALNGLGAEPAYPDSNAALQAALDIYEQTRLLLAGRSMRIQRLDEYATARAACPK